MTVPKPEFVGATEVRYNNIERMFATAKSFELVVLFCFVWLSLFVDIAIFHEMGGEKKKPNASLGYEVPCSVFCCCSEVEYQYDSLSDREKPKKIST
jgi:hypothetical protein